MSLRVDVEVESLRTYDKGECCKFVEKLSIYEFHALFYQDLTFQTWILDHAVFVDKCNACAQKIQDCHPVITEERFRKQAADYLRAGQELFTEFRQSLSSLSLSARFISESCVFYFTSTILYSCLPIGVCTVTTSPAMCPSSAAPNGDVWRCARVKDRSRTSQGCEMFCARAMRSHPACRLSVSPPSPSSRAGPFPSHPRPRRSARSRSRA